MNKSRIGRALRRLYVPAILLFFALIVFDSYLMNVRPIVAWTIPANPPTDWLCQNLVRTSYCVQPTPGDHLVQGVLGLFMIGFAIPVIIANLVLRGRDKMLKPPHFGRDRKPWWMG
ncbi:hypothetical protein PQ455_04790 [Sphingomonas naphthae]|uniref:Uncharacterized protein n=1 Tax=Sphingomonas naphthae TaxID=1813468 RepID=A0ABY7TMU1_9SPHN|nr:hypothetical protein [Sphingomonas naphthae]WCT74551.1 hypothetical protein PQ455_04790 [Sphingomonas naphthae]